MTTLFDSASLVKTARPPRPFALGIGLARAARLPLGPSATDAAWWASESNQDCRDYVVSETDEELDFDRLANESAEMDLICRGLTFA